MDAYCGVNFPIVLSQGDSSLRGGHVDPYGNDLLDASSLCPGKNICSIIVKINKVKMAMGINKFAHTSSVAENLFSPRYFQSECRFEGTGWTIRLIMRGVNFRSPWVSDCGFQ
jgi:hypothetical protein